MTSIRTTVLSSLLLFAVVVLMIPHDAIVVDAFATSAFIVRKTRQYDSILGRRVPLLLVSVSSTEEDETTTKEIIVNYRWWNQSVLATTKTTTTTSPDESTVVAAVNEDENGNETDKVNPIKGTEIETEEETETETEKLMRQVKESGVAGVISYAAWELGFWTVSVPVCVFGYREVTGHWPDFNDKDDLSKLGAEAFAFVNFARFAVPLRIGLALGTTPWIQKNIVDVFLVDSDNDNGSDEKDVAAIDDDDDNDKVDEEDEEDETTRGRFRFRIINRIGNLTNRILRRNNLSEGAGNEEEENSTEEEETTPKEILTNNRWWNQSVAATTATTTDIDIDVDNLDEYNISNKKEKEEEVPEVVFVY